MTLEQSVDLLQHLIAMGGCESKLARLRRDGVPYSRRAAHPKPGSEVVRGAADGAEGVRLEDGERGVEGAL